LLLTEQLSQDLTAAMKAKDDVRTGALRLLLSATRNKRIELGHDLSDDEFLAVVGKEVKQRKDSIAQYTQAGREDLVKEEQAELDIISDYLPEQLGPDQVALEVEKALTSTGASSSSDMGKVMAALGHLKGQADMSEVSKIVRQKLVA
jgi:uncharacterized protein YqeY